jgi:hypothetical protein
MSGHLGRIWQTDYSNEINVFVDRDSDPEGPPLLELHVDTDIEGEGDIVTLRLDATNARQLRLLITKFERLT